MTENSYHARRKSAAAARASSPTSINCYRAVFPETRISREKNAELNFVTTRHGYRYATSVGGTLTGRGGNVIRHVPSAFAFSFLGSAHRSTDRFA